MSKLRKIMAMVLSCMMIFSITAFAYEGTSGSSSTTVETIVKADEVVVILAGEKEKTIEWDLKEDTWYSMELNNESSNDIRAELISDKLDRTPALVVSAGQSAGISSTQKSEPLKAGKYKVVITSLGESNLKGSFKYRLSTNKNNFDDVVKLINVGYTSPENSELVKIEGVNQVVRDDDVVIMWTDYNNINNAIDLLRGYGIIVGDENGDIRPYSFITRAEFAKVICKMLNIGPSLSFATSFGDVLNDDWFYGYVIAAYENGIIEGCDNGNFEPNREVTFEEALKMIVSAMGYMPKAEQMGGYPQGYALVANQLGITEGIDHALALQVKRHIVFEMLCNAMDVPFMLQSGFGTNMDYIIADGENGTQYITFRSKITGIPEKPMVYEKEYMDELNKFMDGGEYYDEIAKDVEKMRDRTKMTGEYTFTIPNVEMNKDATEVVLYITISPDGEKDDISYYILTYKKVDGKWNF